MPVVLLAHVPVLFYKYQYKKSRRMAVESVLCIAWYDWSYVKFYRQSGALQRIFDFFSPW